MAGKKPNWHQILDLHSHASLIPMLKSRGVEAGSTRKAAMIDALAQVLNDRESVRKAIDQLSPTARAVVTIMRRLGGKATVEQLFEATDLEGVTGVDAALTELMRLALVFYATPGSTKHDLWISRDASASYFGTIIPDLRLRVVPAAMELIGDENPLPPPPALQVAEAPPTGIREQSPSVLLHGMFTVVRRVTERPLSITKTTGALAKNDLKALAKLLGGDAEWALFLCALARRAGLLVAAGYQLATAKDAAGFFGKTPQEQITELFEAWTKLSDWSEFFRIAEIETDVTVVPTPHSYTDIPGSRDLQRARAIILRALQRAGSTEWLQLASLVATIKEKNPEFLIPRARKTFWYGRKADHYDGFWKKGQSPWVGRFQKSTDWELVEGRFIRQVLDGPLRWLGVVETGSNDAGEIVSFRFTPLGANLLGLTSEAPTFPQSRTKPIVVQPNFEIIAYTEPEHLHTLYELERFADRVSVDRVAHYKLTRDSVYRGLQEGLTTAEISRFLAENSQNQLPQNIGYSLDDWGRLFERVAIYRSTTVVEAGSEAELDALLAELPEGAAVRLAPCWASIAKEHLNDVRQRLAAAPDSIALDYTTAISRAFTVSDALEIEVPRENLDLWLQARIEQFADPIAEEASAGAAPSRYAMTRESVARAAGLRIDHEEILEFLENFGIPPLPADVELSLRGWSGQIAELALDEAVVLVTEARLLNQLAAVDELRALLWLRVDERCALIRSTDVATLQQQLEKRGIAFDAKFQHRLRAPAKPKVPITPRSSRPANRRVNVAPRPQFSPGESTVPDGPQIELDYNQSSEQHEELLQEAIDGYRCVVIDYQGKAQRSNRMLAPLELANEGGHSYLHAWDYWREDYRVFRLDRILGLAVLDEIYDPDQYDA